MDNRAFQIVLHNGILKSLTKKHLFVYLNKLAERKKRIALKRLSLLCMSLFISSIASGSNGNCYYIGNNKEAVLIDAGISCRETEARMNRLRLSMQTVKAIFISHEHSDHIQGLAVLARKYSLPVFITETTLAHCSNVAGDRISVHAFAPHQPVEIGQLSITAFPKQHDAIEPHSFTIKNEEVTIGVFTDIGSPCSHVVQHFKQCHAAFLEANYDETLLANGKYPHHLKKRISGANGHLSNKQALELFIRHKSPFMSHLLLSHLSKENNHPQLVEDLFLAQAGDTRIVVASRYKETEVFEIKKEMPVVNRKPAKKFTSASQLSLFS